MAIVSPEFTWSGKQITTTDGNEATEATLSIYVAGVLTPIFRVTGFDLEYNIGGVWKSLLPPTAIPLVVD